MVAYIDQFAVVIGNRPVRSYVELAMNIGVAHGVDFSECAENVWRISMHGSGGGMYASDFLRKRIYSYACNLLSVNGAIENVDDFLFGQIKHNDCFSFHSEGTLIDTITFTK